MDAMLGFAAGVMIAASFWSLLSPAIDMAENFEDLFQEQAYLQHLVLLHLDYMQVIQRLHLQQGPQVYYEAL